MKKTTHTLIIPVLLASVFGFTNIAAYANSPALKAQNCDLGNTCPIPGDDGGQTHFTVSPKNGLEYVCEVKSDGGSLKFFISSGEDFSLTQGGGLYKANPETNVELKGRFKDPENQNATGSIKISKLPLSADGSVKCYAKQ